MSSPDTARQNLVWHKAGVTEQIERKNERAVAPEMKCIDRFAVFLSSSLLPSRRKGDDAIFVSSRKKKVAGKKKHQSSPYVTIYGATDRAVHLFIYLFISIYQYAFITTHILLIQKRIHLFLFFCFAPFFVGGGEETHKKPS